MIRTLSLAAILIWTQSATASEVDDILNRVESRDQGRDFQSQFTMTIERNGGAKKREFNWWAYREAGSDRSLIKYISPQSMRDSGLLIISELAKESNQWIYLSKAAKKEPRRVTAQDKGKPFMGSTYFYVDLERFRTKNFQAKLLRKEKWQGYQVAVLELQPKSADYPYSKIITRVDLNSFVPVQSDLYPRSGGKRVYQAEELKKISGIWTITKSSMKDSDGQSRLEVKGIKYNLGTKKSFFNLENLKLSL